MTSKQTRATRAVAGMTHHQIVMSVRDLMMESFDAVEFFAARSHRPVCFVEGTRGGVDEVEFLIYRAGNCAHIPTHKGFIGNCSFPDLFKGLGNSHLPCLEDIDAIYLDGKVVYTREQEES